MNAKQKMTAREELTMARRPDPQLLRGQVSRRLRQLRDDARMTQQRAADELDWSVSKIIRIENANVGISTTDLRALLRLYGMDSGAEIESLVTMVKNSRPQPWYARYESVLNAHFRTMLAYESLAHCIRQIHPTVVPGLLHTESYARAVLAMSYSGTELEQAVEARMARQAHLRADPPQLTFLLDEAAIHRMIGGPSVTRQQLVALLDAAQSATTTIHVIRFSAGMHPGLLEPFLYLRLDDDLGTGVDRVVFLENAQSDYIIHDEDKRLSEYADKWDAARRLALSEPDSVKLIQEQLDLLGDAE